MADPPRRLVGHAQLALQFLCRNAVPRCREQVHRIEPQLQRRPGLLERRANSRMQVMAAPFTGISALCLDPIPAGRTVTLRADMPGPKPNIEQMLKASFIVRELGEESASGEGLRHASFYIKSLLRMQGGYTPIKVAQYPNSQFLLTRCQAEIMQVGANDQITRAMKKLDPSPNWTADAIRKRQEWYTDIALDVWNFRHVKPHYIFEELLG